MLRNTFNLLLIRSKKTDSREI